MEKTVKSCPYCGTELPQAAAFCPYCAQDIHARRSVRISSHQWRKGFKGAVLLVVLMLLAAGVYDFCTPDVYNAYGELTYTVNGNDYHLGVTFRNDPTPEAEYTVQVEAEGTYDRAAKLFITHVDTGVDAGQMFGQQIDTCSVQVIQPEDSPSPVVCFQPEYQNNPAVDGYLLSELQFTGQSTGPVELDWVLSLKNGDTIHLRQRLRLEPVDTLNYYPEDYKMDTIEDLQALVEQIEAEVPLPTVVRLHLPPVCYEGGLTIQTRTIYLYGSVDGQNRRTTFRGPVVVAPEKDPQGFVEHISFQGDGTGTGLTVAADYHVEDCSFTNWDVGLLIGGEDWADPVGCLFEDNGVGFCFDSDGSYFNGNLFEGNTFLRNGTAVELLRVPGEKTLYFRNCQFSGNDADILNPADHPMDLSYAIFE